MVGKYVEYPDSYLSVREALRHSGASHSRNVEIRWVHAEDIERHGPDALLADACGIVVPGGFGTRGVEGMVEAVHYARKHQVPYLGLCLGLQVMVIEWARNVLGPPRRQLRGIGARHAKSGGTHNARPRAGHRQGRRHAAGRHHAAGRLPVPPSTTR